MCVKISKTRKALYTYSPFTSLHFSHHSPTDGGQLLLLMAIIKGKLNAHDAHSLLCVVSLLVKLTAGKNDEDPEYKVMFTYNGPMLQKKKKTFVNESLLWVILTYVQPSSISNLRATHTYS